MKKCPFCAEDIQEDAIFCRHCERDLITGQISSTEAAPTDKVRTITETKCTCHNCGKVWHYGKKDSLENFSNAAANVGKSMMCCTGCWPALFIHDKKVVDMKKCPQCGSRNITSEKVSYAVSK